jgi:hypothetical protein
MICNLSALSPAFLEWVLLGIRKANITCGGRLSGPLRDYLLSPIQASCKFPAASCSREVTMLVFFFVQGTYMQGQRREWECKGANKGIKGNIRAKLRLDSPPCIEILDRTTVKKQNFTNLGYDINSIRGEGTVGEIMLKTPNGCSTGTGKTWTQGITFMQGI